MRCIEGIKRKIGLIIDPTKASRPFSSDRRGFVLSEGVGVVLISKNSYAKKKDWPVRGIIKGGYANCDANHLTRISVENIKLCMKAALDSSRVDKTQVDCNKCTCDVNPNR